MQAITDRTELNKLKINPSTVFLPEEKETIGNIDGLDNTAIIYTNIGTHIKSILSNHYVELIEAQIEGQDIVQVRVKVPITYLKVLVRKKPRKDPWLSRIFN